VLLEAVAVVVAVPAVVAAVDGRACLPMYNSTLQTGTGKSGRVQTKHRPVLVDSTVLLGDLEEALSVVEAEEEEAAGACVVVALLAPVAVQVPVTAP